jgi:hypothetical protein
VKAALAAIGGYIDPPPADEVREDGTVVKHYLHEVTDDAYPSGFNVGYAQMEPPFGQPLALDKCCGAFNMRHWADFGETTITSRSMVVRFSDLPEARFFQDLGLPIATRPSGRDQTLRPRPKLAHLGLRSQWASCTTRGCTKGGYGHGMVDKAEPISLSGLGCAQVALVATRVGSVTTWATMATTSPTAAVATNPTTMRPNNQRIS